MKELQHLNKYFKKHWIKLTAGFVFVTLSNVFGVFPPQVIRYAFDLVKENINVYYLLDGFQLQSNYLDIFNAVLIFFAAVVLSLALIKGIFTFLMRQTIIVMSRLIEYDLKNEVYEHYQALDLAFYKKNNTGDLMARITEDISRVRMYLGPAIMYAINLVGLFIMVIYTMIQVNPTLTLYTLLPLPILSISIYYVSNLINKKSEKIQAQLSNLTIASQEVFSGIRVLKSYVQEDNYLNWFSDSSENYREKALDLAKTEAYFHPLMLFLIGLSTITTIYIGGQQVIAGTITAGNIAEFVIYVNYLTWPVTAIGWVASIIQRAAASQKRINEFLKTKPLIENNNNEVVDLEGRIEFNNVEFTYPDTGIQALKDISFTLEKGQKMAIIGKTGSGKSTIAELILRLYDIKNGQINIDDKNIKDWNLYSLRKQIGYNPQDVFLFSNDINNNISFAHDANQEAIYKAAKQSSIKSEIEDLPNGFETIVGERGVTLSGGQKQRIALARALIKNPNLLILDDSLSAVDAKTEQDILNYLNDVLTEKTAIIITHRIFSLLEFDKIIVLDDGKIIESGTHDSLIESKGSYYELFQMQQQNDSKIIA